MTCSQIAELAPLYRSGELEPARAASFTAHLAACQECAREIRDQAQLDDLLRTGVLAEDVNPTAVNQRFYDSMAAELDGAPPTASRVPSRPRWRVAAIASVAALLLLTVGYRHLWRAHSVYADAAADHRSEVVNGHPRPWVTDPVAVASLAEHSGIAPHSVLALAPPGYHLARAKRCALNGRPFLHLVYSDGAREFSAYLRPRDAEAPVIPSASWWNGGSGAETAAALYTRDFGAEHLGCVETRAVTAVIVTDESADAARYLTNYAATALGPRAAIF